MAASVNAVSPQKKRDSYDDLDLLLKGLNLAVGVYGQVNERDKVDELAKITAANRKEDKATEKDKFLAEQENKKTETAAKVGEKYRIAKPGESGIKIPGSGGIFGLPDDNTLFVPLARDELALKNKELDQKAAEKLAKAEELSKGDQEAVERYNMLQTNANKLKNLIKKEGTFSMFGTESAEMDSAIYQMALDYAKLVDPTSVAREGEVAAAQKYMLPIREWGGLGYSNKNAESLIDKYKESLDQRLTARGFQVKDGILSKGKPSLNSGGGMDAETEALIAERARRLKNQGTAGR